MKKLLLLLFLLICTLNITGCHDSAVDPKPIDPSPADPVFPSNMCTISFDTDGGTLISSFIIEKGDLLPIDVIGTPLKDDFTFIGWSLTGEEENLFDFNLPINSDITLIAVWDANFKDYGYFLDEYVPSVITESIELPQNVDDLKLIWSTTDPITLNNKGVCNPDIKDVELTVNLEVYDNGYSTYYTKPVVVKANNFKDLSTGATFGYYSGWNYYGLPNEITTAVDVINICFAYVNNDFSLSFGDLSPYISSIMRAHNYGIRVVLSVQGYASGGTNFSRAASTDKGRKKLAENMLELVKKYHMDGIDIDWEYPGYGTGVSTSVDRRNYTLFIKQLKETFNNESEKYIVTAAIPGGPYLPERFDLAEVSKYLDYIHIMTYDMQAGGRCTHHSALYPSNGTAGGCSVSESVDYYVRQGVPESKCVVGIAFYGRGCTGTALGGSGSGYKAITYTKIYDKYLSRLNHGVKVYFDEVAQASYLIDTANNYFIGYDNEQAIMAKCKYAKDNHLGGVMIWELGEDETNTLIQAVKKGMK